MTSTVTQATFLVLTSASYDSITKTVGLVSIFALLVLMLLKEFVRVHPAPRLAAWIRAFDLALVPLLITFTVIVTARLAELLQG
jgi:uncharacterized membrane protein